MKKFSYQNTTSAYRKAMTEILANPNSIERCFNKGIFLNIFCFYFNFIIYININIYKADQNIDFGSFEVESILNCRVTKDDQIEYLVKWKNYDISASTWESEENLDCPEILKHFEENLIFSLG